MNTKRKAIEIWLSDNRTQVIVKSPNMEQFSEYLDSFVFIQKIATAFQNIQSNVNGNLDFSKSIIQKGDLDKFFPLLSVLSSYRELKERLGDRKPSELNSDDWSSDLIPLTVEDFKSLSIEDGTGIIYAYVQLLSPENTQQANPTIAGG